MKRAKNRRHLQAHIIVLLTATCMIALIIIASTIAARRQHVTARVEIAPPLVEAVLPRPLLQPTNAAFPDGEVERTATRVREVSALVMGLTLLAVNEAIKQQPVRSAEELSERFVTHGLLPPTIRPTQSPAILESDIAVLYVRYRAVPLALEIVSLGRNAGDGTPIIGRIITGSEENAALFIARQATGVTIPEPFLPAAQIVALNWSAEPWRERALAQQEWEQINYALHTAQAN